MPDGVCIYVCVCLSASVSLSFLRLKLDGGGYRGCLRILYERRRVLHFEVSDDGVFDGVCCCRCGRFFNGYYSSGSIYACCLHSYILFHAAKRGERLITARNFIKLIACKRSVCAEE